MKKLLYLGFVLMLGSCGSSTVNLDGRDVSIVEIDNLEVMDEDLGKMNWDDAMKACADLGDGWRLPNPIELNLLYKNKGKIGSFAPSHYWSSYGYDARYAMAQNFFTGKKGYGKVKKTRLYARAVRD